MSEKRFTFKCLDNNCSIFDDGVWLKIEEIVDLLNEQDRKIRKLEQENKALGSNVKWFAHQLENHTLYSDDFLETLETIEGEETVEKIRERQNEIIKILKKEELL